MAVRELDSTTKQIGIAGWLLAAVIMVLINIDVPEGENGGTGPMIFTIILAAVVAAALFLLVVPRAANPGRAGLIVGVLALLTVLIFWSGLCFVLGAAAFALGRRAGASTEGRAAQALGVLAIVAGIVVVLMDQLS